MLVDGFSLFDKPPCARDLVMNPGIEGVIKLQKLNPYRFPGSDSGRGT